MEAPGDMTKKELILQAAQEVFGRHGYSGTTMKMISEKAGVAFGLVAHYYGNKEKLFLTAGFEMIDAILERILEETSRAGNGLDAVRIFVKTYLDYTLENRATFPILIRCSPFSDDEVNVDRTSIAEKFRDLINAIKGFIERGVKDGSIRDLPVESTAFMIYANILGAVRTRLLTPYNPDGLYRETLAFVTRSIERTANA